MITYLRNELSVFKRYLPLLSNLVNRDIKVKYRRSALGVVWSVLNPLLMMAVQAMVFSTIFRAFIPEGNFPIYLLSGQILFNFFSESTQLGLDSVLGGAGLLKKVYIPKYIFPLEKVIFSLTNLGFSLIALFGVIIFTKDVGFSPYLLLFPVLAAILFVFNLGVSLVLASLTVFFRDIKHFYGVFVMALTYLTPLFYDEQAIANPMVVTIIHINPMYWFVSIGRDLILWQQFPDPMAWIIICCWAVAFMVIGLFIFKKSQDHFILHI